MYKHKRSKLFRYNINEIKESIKKEEVIANPELSKEQLTKCKIGQGYDTCAFIILSPDGFECARWI